jgi:twitching motility protein PilT
MARIDSLLSIVVQQGANELRVGTDKEPKMLAYGAAKRLAIPATSAETLRDLMGEILTPEREGAMRAKGRLEVTHAAGSIGTFNVTLIARGPDGFEAVFLRGGKREAPREAAPPPPPPPPPPAVAAHPSPVEPVSHAPAPSQATIEPQPLQAAEHARTSETATPLLTELVARAASLRASDLHLADGELARARVDGGLSSFDASAPIDVAATLGLDAASRDRLAHGGSLDFACVVEGVGRVRIHVFQVSEGLAASIRLLPPTTPSLGSLGFPVSLADVVDLPNGLVLVCGAAGSGKSTTLAALAQEALRKRSIVLTTLEDPIEYALSAGEASLVRRRQVGRDVRDFTSGLRDALREDPDVLLVGELRDPETIALALTAAETGHLVLASMHSRGAASAIERIVDAMPEGRQANVRVQLAESLRIVVAQRLLPRLRGSGRIPAIEVLRVTHAVAALIRESKTAQIPTAIQSGKRDGMLSLERCLADRVAAGEITLEDARAAANDPSSLAMYVGK